MYVQSIIPAHPDHLTFMVESHSLYVSEENEWHWVGRLRETVGRPERIAFFAVVREDADEVTNKIVPVLNDLLPLSIEALDLDLMKQFGAPEHDAIVRQGRTENKRVITHGTDPQAVIKEHLDTVSRCSSCEPVFTEDESGIWTATHNESCTMAQHTEDTEQWRMDRCRPAISDAYKKMVAEGEIRAS